jgi:hypothetical protein
VTLKESTYFTTIVNLKDKSIENIIKEKEKSIIEGVQHPRAIKL